NTESKVVAGRVVAVDTSGNPMVVTLGLLTFQEMFPGLEVEERIDLSTAPVIMPPDITAAYNVTRVGNTFTFIPKAAAGKSAEAAIAQKASLDGGSPAAPMAGPTGTRALPPFTSCERTFTGAGGGDENSPLPITLSAPPQFTVDISPTLDYKFKLLAPHIERFVFSAQPNVTIQGGVNVAVAFEGKIECKVELFAFRIPVSGPLSLVVGGLVPVGVGIEAGGKLTVATLGISAKAEVKGKVKAGIVCAGFSCSLETGLDNMEAKLTPTVDAPSIGDLRLEPAFSAFGYMEAAIGNPILSSIRFDFIKIKAGAELAGSFALKESQIADRAYQSDYKLSLKASAGPSGNLSGALTLFGLANASVLELVISTDIAKSPSGIATGAVTANKATFVSGDNINFTVKLDPATVDFLPIIGPYNVKKILLVRKVGGVVTVVASVNATPAQSTFSLSYTAPDSGSVVQFSAFVVTALLPLDLLALEIGQAVGGVEGLTPAQSSVFTPDVTMDAAGNALAVWRQFDARDNIWANRYTIGTGWGTAQMIESHALGEVAAPKIVSDAAGNAIAMWANPIVGVSYSIFTSRFTPSTGWEIATPLLANGDDELDLRGTDDPQYSIAMNAAGEAIAVWSQYDRAAETLSIWSRRYSPTSGWGSAARLSAADAFFRHQPNVAIDANGNAFAVWMVGDDTGPQIETSRFVVGSGWSAVTILPRLAGDPGLAPYQQVQLAMDKSGQAIAVWRTIFTLSTSRYITNVGWSPAEIIEDVEIYGNTTEPSIVVDATGVATVAWAYSKAEAQGQTRVYRLRYNRETPGVGWSGPMTIVPDQAGEIAGPKLSIIAGCRIIATWNDAETNAARVWASRFRLTVGWDSPSLVQSIPQAFPSYITVPNASDGNGNAMAVWAQSDGTTQKLWSQFFPRDVGASGNDCAEASNIIVTSPPTAVAGTPIAVTVEIRNSRNERDQNFVGALRFASNDPIAALPPDYTFTLADGGRHTFEVTPRTAGLRTVSAIVGNAGASATTMVSPGPPTQLAFKQEPPDVKIDAPIIPAVALRLVDAFGNTATAGTGSVTLTLETNPNAASLAGTTQTAVVDGVATFAGLSVNKLGKFRLGATYSGGLSAVSRLFTVNNGVVQN
ncbi:MAG: hypothetical protein ABL931_15345, partial [Usitatibacteraceae bacterium]